MAKRNDLSVTYLKLLLYGQAGSTKTRTAGTAALDERTAPVLWFNLGGNPISMRFYEKLPDVIDITKLSDFNPFYDWLKRGQPNEPIVKEWGLRPPYKTVVVDGLTGTQRLSNALVIGYANPEPGSIPPATEIQHHGKILGQMTWFGDLFFDKLPLHVICTALEKDEMDKSGTRLFRPLLTGQSANEIPGQALAVARMLHIEKVDNRTKMALKDVPGEIISVAVFRGGSNFFAKDQYGGLPPIMVNPTVTKILDYIEGAKAGKALPQSELPEAEIP